MIGVRSQLCKWACEQSEWGRGEVTNTSCACVCVRLWMVEGVGLLAAVSGAISTKWISAIKWRWLVRTQCADRYESDGRLWKSTKFCIVRHQSYQPINFLEYDKIHTSPMKTKQRVGSCVQVIEWSSNNTKDLRCTTMQMWGETVQCPEERKWICNNLKAVLCKIMIIGSSLSVSNLPVIGRHLSQLSD